MGRGGDEGAPARPNVFAAMVTSLKPDLLGHHSLLFRTLLTVFANKAVVVPLGLSPDQTANVARRLAAEGAAVILVTGGEGSGDQGAAGRLAAELAPARTAVMVLSSDEPTDLDALVELLGELFP